MTEQRKLESELSRLQYYENCAENYINKVEEHKIRKWTYLAASTITATLASNIGYQEGLEALTNPYFIMEGLTTLGLIAGAYKKSRQISKKNQEIKSKKEKINRIENLIKECSSSSKISIKRA